jgi:putative phosphoesterase
VLVGLVSDTHGLLRPELFAALEGVEHILHAGDLGEYGLLAELEAIAPVTAVYGNTDGWDVRDHLPAVATVRLGEVEAVVMHGNQFGSPTPARVAGAYPDAGLVVFGHSHVPVIERLGRVLAVNPGSAGPRRFNGPTTIALATIEGALVEARLVSLLKR